MPPPSQERRVVVCSAEALDLSVLSRLQDTDPFKRCEPWGPTLLSPPQAGIGSILETVHVLRTQAVPQVGCPKVKPWMEVAV